MLIAPAALCWTARSQPRSIGVGANLCLLVRSRARSLLHLGASTNLCPSIRSRAPSRHPPFVGGRGGATAPRTATLAIPPSDRSGRATADRYPRGCPVAWANVRGLADVRETALSCTLCPLAAGRTTVVFGEGDPRAGLMVVGEGPGRDEDLQGRPFVGRSGQLLDRLLLEEAGLRREQVYIANVVKCRPPGNRDPLPEEIAACRPFLDQQITLIGPRVILTLGNFATKTLLDTREGITRLRGRTWPFGAEGTVIVPTFHPAAALRGSGEVVAQMRADFVRARVVLDGAIAPADVVERG